MNRGKQRDEVVQEGVKKRPFRGRKIVEKGNK